MKNYTVYAPFKQGFHFSGNWKRQLIRLRSWKSQEKNPESVKGLRICVVGVIWLWQLNKII